MKPFKATYLILLVYVLALTNCANNNTVYKTKTQQQKLTYADIFNTDIIKDVLFEAEEQHVDSLKTASRLIFLQAIDVYKNKKNPHGSISLFKSSILIFPDAKTYYELGNALLEINNRAALQDAIKAFNIAAELNFQPLSSVYFNKAIALNLLRKEQKNIDEYDHEEYVVMNTLKLAFENGFSDTTLLKRDARLQNIISTSSFKQLMVWVAIRKLGNNQNGLFHVFKNAYPAINESFEIAKTDVDMKKYKESISYDFAKFIPEMQNTSFSREVSHDYFYVAKVKETDFYTALVYASVSFYGEAMQPVNTTLAVYNNLSGEIISRKIIACQCSAEKIRTSSITKGVIAIEDYERIWEKQIIDVSFEENSVQEYKLLSKAVFEIDNGGVIQIKQMDKNFNDTFNLAAK